MKTMYRLKYKNGKVGAWNTDLDFVKKCAELFNAKIETRIFNPITF